MRSLMQNVLGDIVPDNDQFDASDNDIATA